MLALWLACRPEPSPPPPRPATVGENAVGPALGAPYNPSGPHLPVGLSLTVAPLVLGAASEITVSGAAAGAPITVWRGDLGGLSCPDALGGWCIPLGHAAAVVEGTADDAGSWVGAWRVRRDEPVGDYPVLLATDGAASSLVVMRRLFVGAPADDFATDALDEGWWLGQEPVEVPPGDYFDLVQDGQELLSVWARGNETATISLVFHDWIDVGDWYAWASPPRASASAAPTVTVDGPEWFGVDASLALHSLASGTWTVDFGDEYWEPSGYYDLQVRVTAPDEARAWFVDRDGDSYGDPDGLVEAAVSPDGAVWRAADCDDADEGVHPEGWDACEDGVDQDCTGADKPCRGAALVDGLPVGAASSAHLLASGWGDAPLGDVDGDGVPEVWFRDHSSTLVVAEVVPGQWGPGETLADGNGLGQTVAGDFDHDGTRDVAFGRGDPDQPGEVKIAATPTDPASVVGDAWATLVGASVEDGAGRSLAVGGDVDGDGWGDWVVGADEGVWLVTDVRPGTASLSAAATWLPGGMGGAVPPADLDGDGLAELVVSGPVAAVYHGPVDALEPAATFTYPAFEWYDVQDLGDTDGDGLGEVLLWDGASAVLLFEDPNGPLSAAGAAVRAEATRVGGATLVDLDRDGLDDLVVSDPLVDWTWAVHVAYGPLPATLVLPDDADVVLPSAEGEVTGRGVTSADYDADGSEDLAVVTYAAPDGDPLNWDRWYATDIVLTGP